MEMIGPLGIVIAIIFIILMAMKGYNIIYIAPLASIIVILTNQMDFFSSLIGKETSYMTGLTGFVVNFLRCFYLVPFWPSIWNRVELLNPLHKKYYRLQEQKSRFLY